MLWLLVLIPVLVFLAPAIFRRPPSQAQGPVARGSVGDASRRELIGVTSCAASVCHGGAVLGAPRSEATTWRALDPHARAYDTLLTAQSTAIAKHLWGDKLAAMDAPLCLKCHVHPDYEQARPNFALADGVGCESCHGAAQDWVAPHYRAAWKQADRHSLGMSDTKSLPGRANVCVTCHVGTAAASVDHDLIAAGHPALRFEFATYFANLPPHWDVAKDRRANHTTGAVDFDLQAWAVGQDISAAAAAELLAHRADPAGKLPWPELAQMDCFACHHDLKSKSWRQQESFSGSPPGGLRWSSWYFAMAPVLHRQPEEGAAKKGSHPLVPDPRKSRTAVALEARKVASALRHSAATRVADAATLERLQKKVEEAKHFGTWDEATQCYLALFAARAKYQNDPLRERLRDAVTFPARVNSPARFEPVATQKPRTK